MHHLPVKTCNLMDSSCSNDSKLNGSHGQPLCPKPRRVGSSVPEFLIPLTCSKHSQSNGDRRLEILDMIADKTIDGRESMSIGCSPSCYSGSPPNRTDNPLVHDVQFIHQMELLSPFSQADKFRLTTSAYPI